jgi:hypothetical protein
MNYWIFIATSHKVGAETFSGDDILNQRIQDRYWGLGEKTPNRRALKAGDRVIFYVGNPKKVFAASATLASDSFTPSEKEKDGLDHGKAFYRSDYGVRLEDIEVWSIPRSTEELVPQLDFIENKDAWYVYFQGGVRWVSEKDFRSITEGREHTLVEKIASTSDLESASQFALESHLEEFIAENWAQIDFGSKLHLYSVDDQSGRQFPAGQWSIDFLCLDQDRNDLVVVELKRGKTSDAAVGQVLRYMGWVTENIAAPGQHVRGVIVAKDIDNALSYAVSGLTNVSVLTYKIDFRLFPRSKAP